MLNIRYESIIIIGQRSSDRMFGSTCRTPGVQGGGFASAPRCSSLPDPSRNEYPSGVAWEACGGDDLTPLLSTLRAELAVSRIRLACKGGSLVRAVSLGRHWHLEPGLRDGRSSPGQSTMDHGWVVCESATAKWRDALALTSEDGAAKLGTYTV